MSYNFPRHHKIEENVERDIVETVSEQVCEYFGVDDVTELTKEQIDEVVLFKDDLNEYSVLQWGYSWVVQTWDDHQFDMENEE
jgi:broad-specificity NMP kinase